MPLATNTVIKNPRQELARILTNDEICLDTSCGNPLVNARDDAEEGDACCADSEGDLGIHIALESGQRTVGLCDIHGLHDQQIVVE